MNEMRFQREVIDHGDGRRTETVRDLLVGEWLSRQQAIRSMLGFRVKEGAKALSYTFTHYLEETRDISEHITNLIAGKGVKLFDHDSLEKWQSQAERKLRNFLSTRMALRDHTYALESSLWNADDDGDQFKKSYAQKTQEHLATPEGAFLQDLRNLSIHKGSLPFSYELQSDDTGSDVSVYFAKEDLLEMYSNWKSTARAFIETHEENVLIENVILKNCDATFQFYTWLFAALEVRYEVAIQESITALELFETWSKSKGLRRPPDLMGDPES